MPIIVLGRLANLLSIVWFLLFAMVAQVAAREIGPDERFCDVINSLQPGEKLTLKPGNYAGPCRVRRGGLPDLPTVIEGQSLADKPRIIYDGQTRNVLEVGADYVTIRGLKIGPTKKNVDGVRIFSHAGVTIEDCEFNDLAGIAVSATRTSVTGLTVRRNVVERSHATAMYFGCHDGNGCQHSDLLVELNFINGVDATDSEIGYGIQVKLNSAGVIRDNVIIDTKGPAIMVYGASDDTHSSVVERNFVARSHTSSGILIGGGPVVVRNNIATANSEGGITLQDYAGRGLLRRITIANNTSVDNYSGEFVVPSTSKLSDVMLVDNVAAARNSHPVYPQERPGIVLKENVECGRVACFADPLVWNFSPRLGSPLIRQESVTGIKSVKDDYYGRMRVGPNKPGAIQLAGPPIKLGIKSLQ